MPEEETSRSSRRRSGLRSGFGLRDLELEVWAIEREFEVGGLEDGGNVDGWGAAEVEVLAGAGDMVWK